MNSIEMEFSPENTPEYKKLLEAGIELKSVRHEPGISSDETNVVQLNEKTISESEFNPPLGYKKISFAEMVTTQME